MPGSRSSEKLLLVYITGWVLVVLVQHLRANTEHAGMLTTFYGVAPNLILGFCAPSLFLLLSRRAKVWFPGLSGAAWFWLSVTLGVGGVVAWEFWQLVRTQLVFDRGDVAATVLGGAVFVGCWPLTRRALTDA